MPPKAHIMHRIVGRTRLRIPARRGDNPYFTELITKLGAVPGVDDVTVNPLTGSILIQHNDDADRLLEQLRELRLFHLVPPEAEDLNPNLTLQLAEKLKRTDDRLSTLTGGRIDLNAAMIVALLAGAGFQFLRGAVLPPGASLLWYAFGLAWLRPPKTPRT
jgi:hypothetical protein